MEDCEQHHHLQNYLEDQTALNQQNNNDISETLIVQNLNDKIEYVKNYNDKINYVNNF